MPMPTEDRSEVRSFNPEMLTLRREALGLTQSALAAELGVSQAKLSRIEAELLEPEDDLVDSMASALRRPREFFFLRERAYGPGVSEFYHRKRQSVGAKALRQAHALINEDIISVKRLLRSAEVDTSGFDQAAGLEALDSSPEDAARAVRAVWGVPAGPIKSVVKLIEDAGGVVIPMDFPSSKIFAVSRYVPGLPPMFFIGSNTPGDLQRSTLCHELAHLLLHRTPNAEMETEADRFAAEFLMPADDIRDDFADGVSLPRLAALKPHWRVSMKNLLYRAKTLGGISERNARYLWMRMGKLGYRRREPAELDIPTEKPSLLAELLEMHRQDLGFSLDQLQRLLLFSRPELETRYGLRTHPDLDGRPRLRLIG